VARLRSELTAGRGTLPRPLVPQPADEADVADAADMVAIADQDRGGRRRRTEVGGWSAQEEGQLALADAVADGAVAWPVRRRRRLRRALHGADDHLLPPCLGAQVAVLPGALADGDEDLLPAEARERYEQALKATVAGAADVRP
jgi:hypothetical protein